jgi:hypothetical protein
MLRGHRDLKVYQLSYKLAMEIFHLSKAFPREEIYSLTDQIRRSSRSVAANIAEGFRKRRYRLTLGYEEVGKMLSGMMANPERFSPA